MQISFSCVAYPCVLLQYFGQTAYIIVHPQDYQSAFWSSVPGPVFWPLLVIGTLAAIVASQVSLGDLRWPWTLNLNPDHEPKTLGTCLVSCASPFGLPPLSSVPLGSHLPTAMVKHWARVTPES